VFGNRGYGQILARQNTDVLTSTRRETLMSIVGILIVILLILLVLYLVRRVV
jgi:uncharacterized protein HemY